MKRFALAAATIAAATVAVPSNAATYTYAGSWIVGNGPDWFNNPAVYTGESAAAVLFGGSAADYQISTISSSVADIDNMAWYDSYGTGALSKHIATFDTSSVNGGTYSNFGSSSAYVHDNSCFNRYGNTAASCSGDGTQYVNYAFRVDSVTGAVPEPATWTMMLLGMGAVGFAMRRRQKVAVSYAV